MSYQKILQIAARKTRPKGRTKHGCTSHDMIVAKRKRFVAEMRLRGMTLQGISLALAEMADSEINPQAAAIALNPKTGKAWHMRTIHKDVEELQRDDLKQATDDISKVRARNIARLEFLYSEALTSPIPIKEQLDLARKALHDQNLLLGLISRKDYGKYTEKDFVNYWTKVMQMLTPIVLQLIMDVEFLRSLPESQKTELKEAIMDAVKKALYYAGVIQDNGNNSKALPDGEIVEFEEITSTIKKGSDNFGQNEENHKGN